MIQSWITLRTPEQLLFYLWENGINLVVFRFFYTKKDVNRDSHIASSPIPQNSFFKGVRCLILASSQRKLRGYIEFFKFDVTIKKNKKIKFVQNLKVSTDSYKTWYQTSLSNSAFTHEISAR